MQIKQFGIIKEKIIEAIYKLKHAIISINTTLMYYNIYFI